MPSTVARSVAPGLEPSCETAARPVPAKVVMRGPPDALDKIAGRTTEKIRTPADATIISTPASHNHRGGIRGLPGGLAGDSAGGGAGARAKGVVYDASPAASFDPDLQPSLRRAC